jgi:hypothetical protein
MARFDFGEAIKVNQGFKEKLKDFVPVKPVPRVVFQSPAPGTPLLKGMTVEVKLLSTSDVPLGGLVLDAPIAIKDVPLSEFATLMEKSPGTEAILAGGALPDDKRAEFVAGINAGLGSSLKTPLTEADAAKTFAILKGFVR